MNSIYTCFCYVSLQKKTLKKLSLYGIIPLLQKKQFTLFYIECVIAQVNPYYFAPFFQEVNESFPTIWSIG